MTWDRIKRVLKIILGFILLPLGVVMLALPGPGWLTIVLALAILAGEFVWARKLLDRLKEVATFCAVTATPGTAAPVWSRTMPTMDAVVDCARVIPHAVASNSQV